MRPRDSRGALIPLQAHAGRRISATGSGLVARKARSDPRPGVDFDSSLWPSPSSTRSWWRVARRGQVQQVLQHPMYAGAQNRSRPRTTSVTPCSASSITTKGDSWSASPCAPAPRRPRPRGARRSFRFRRRAPRPSSIQDSSSAGAGDRRRHVEAQRIGRPLHQIVALRRRSRARCRDTAARRPGRAASDSRLVRRDAPGDLRALSNAG